MNWLDKPDPAVIEKRQKQCEAMKQLQAKGDLPLTSAKIETQVAANEMAAEAEKVRQEMDKNLADAQKAAFKPRAFTPLPTSGAVGQAASFWHHAPQIYNYIDPTPRKPLEPELTIVDAVTGWRRWSVEMFGCELRSNNGVPWKPYEKLVAECKRSPSVADPVDISGCKGVHCTCGIYAYKTPEDAKFGENAPADLASGSVHCWGEVYLWGRVIEHAKGWRAQFAYPKSFVDGGIAGQLATAYGVKTIPDTYERKLNSAYCACGDDYIRTYETIGGGSMAVCEVCGKTAYYPPLASNAAQNAGMQNAGMGVGPYGRGIQHGIDAVTGIKSILWRKR